MNEQELIRRRAEIAFGEIQYLIRLLYSVRDPDGQSLALNQLWNQVAFLQFLMTLLGQEQMPAQVLPTFTREQLATYTGRNGNPAYVAVGGVVYDVTNNAAWSLASHFGLPAGRDLTAEFGSCHAAQQWILNTLKQVGRLA